MTALEQIAERQLRDRQIKTRPITAIVLKTEQSENELYKDAANNFEIFFRLMTGLTPFEYQQKVIKEIQDFLELVWTSPITDTSERPVLNINLPPGAGKSTIVTKLISWVLGKRPTERFGIISAKGDLAGFFQASTLNDLQNNEAYQKIFPDPRCRPDYQRGFSFSKGFHLLGLPDKELTPSLIASGLYGSILGKRFNGILIDDGQDQEMVATDYQRQKTWDTMTGTIMSRADPGCWVINVQQRLHESDFSGGLKEHYKAKELVVRAIQEDGSSYCPERFSIGVLRQQRMANPGQFETWYMQNPGQGDGNVFRREWFKYHSGATPAGRKVQSWDTAESEDEKAAYSAYVEAVITKNDDVYVTDFDWQRLEFPDLIKWIAKIGARNPRLVLIEKKSSGTSAISYLKVNSSLPVIPYNPKGSKEDRANAVTGWIEAGKVYFPQHHEKLAEFERFLLGFPMTKFVDPVDAFTQLLAYAIQKATMPDRKPAYSSEEDY